MAAYTVCRLLFLLFNAGLFHDAGPGELFAVFFYGIRFDIFSVLVTNTVFILLHLFPGRQFYSKNFQKLIKWVFYIPNISALLLNCIDFIYFRFSQRRSTADAFTPEAGGDIKNNLLQYIADFWYLLLILLVLILLIEFTYRKVSLKNDERKKPSLITSLAVISFVAAAYIIGVRGGIQYKPISIQSAAKYSSPQLIPAILNTPFTIIKTRDMEGLSPDKFMTDDEADKQFKITRLYEYSSGMKNRNVIVIILESFSKEYVGFFNNGKGFTPFLDSLCRKSLVFNNAFANAKRSIEGIPAITASIPALMNESFISSAYNVNRFNSLAGLLKPFGYSSAFFHGGNNGTMGFESFSYLSGYQKYYGRNEYKGPSTDYDGSWGIYDEPYYRFFISEMNKIKQPFYSTFFSLSSHHPYSIPAIYKNKFPKGDQPIYESIGYADHALEIFFTEANKTNWYNNTLFVITADHTGPAFAPYYKTSKGIFEVPIIYYAPGDSFLTGLSSVVTQQCDILPSVLDYLNFPSEFSAFGNSIFRNGDAFALNYTGNLFQYFSNEYMLQSDGDEIVGIYKYRTDSMLRNNIVNSFADKNRLTLKANAVLQQFRQSMIHNSIVKK